MPKTTVVVTLLSSEPRLFARWARRLKPCALPGRGAFSARRTTRSIAFEATQRTSIAPDDDDQDRQRLADQPGRAVGQRLVAGPVVDRRARPAVVVLAGGGHVEQAVRDCPGDKKSAKACEGGYEERARLTKPRIAILRVCSLTTRSAASSARSSLLAGAAWFVLGALVAPAVADTPEAWEQAPDVSPLGFLLVLLILPLGAAAVISLLAVLPTLASDSGYEPGQSWRGDTEWFGGPTKGVKAADDGHPRADRAELQGRRRHQWPLVTSPAPRRPRSTARSARPRRPAGSSSPSSSGRDRGESRPFAQRLHAALVLAGPQRADPGRPRPRGCSRWSPGSVVRRSLSDDAVRLAVAGMESAFSGGDLVGGIKHGVGQLAEAARKPATLHE